MKKNIKLSPMNTSLKSIFHSLVFIVIGGVASIPTHAQHRYADLRVKIIDPAPHSIVYSPGYLPYAFEVVNQGPDSLWPLDSMRYEMVHSGGGGRPFSRHRLGKYVVPGDSFIIQDSIYLDFYKDYDKFEIRFSVSPAMISRDYGDRNLWEEFWEDTKDNSASLPLRHRRSLSVDPLEASVTRVYPNPCTTGRLTLTGVSITDIRINDVLGRVVDYEVVEQHPKQVTLSLHPKSSGMHVVQYHSGKTIINQKVYFQFNQ